MSRLSTVSMVFFDRRVLIRKTLARLEEGGGEQGAEGRVAGEGWKKKEKGLPEKGW